MRLSETRKFATWAKMMGPRPRGKRSTPTIERALRTREASSSLPSPVYIANMVTVIANGAIMIMVAMQELTTRSFVITATSFLRTAMMRAIMLSSHAYILITLIPWIISLTSFTRSSAHLSCALRRVSIALPSLVWTGITTQTTATHMITDGPTMNPSQMKQARIWKGMTKPWLTIGAKKTKNWQSTAISVWIWPMLAFPIDARRRHLRYMLPISIERRRRARCVMRNCEWNMANDSRSLTKKITTVRAYP